MSASNSRFSRGIVFSRDRAFQLDGTLRSFVLHCQDWESSELFILYRATNEAHARQYECLIEENAHYNIHFIRENSFKDDLLEFLIFPERNSRKLSRYYLAGWLSHWFRYPFRPSLPSELAEMILFLVDDNIFVRQFTVKEIRDALFTHPNAMGFSLRLGTNTTYCYPADRLQNSPDFVKVDERISQFRWTGADGDFGYPMEVSSSVYRLVDLLPLLTSIPYKNPNGLEEQMSMRTKLFYRSAPNLLCFQQSVCFSNPINRVQTVLDNRVGKNQEYSDQGLAELFDAGYRLDVEAYRDFLATSCHQEVEVMIQKRNKRIVVPR